MKTYSGRIVNCFIIASVAIILFTGISPVIGQNQNQRFQEILQDRERETITITAQLFGDIKFDADETSNVFFIMHDGKVIPMGKESGNLSADEIASVYIYRPGRSKDLFIEITDPSEKSKTETSTQDFPAGRILYIVDGMELMEKHVHKIPPKDILNITVLKDASAAEKYGKTPDEIEGVIIIETRRAKFNE
ncbi:MAG: hypothetical protein EA393_02635 [Bacteroidetes bacterium]|nr:MAG: hypothetical protein EA393_02635 [Bacteroidota bacterium]